jgi:hypothetical protein
MVVITTILLYSDQTCQVFTMTNLNRMINELDYKKYRQINLSDRYP